MLWDSQIFEVEGLVILEFCSHLTYFGHALVRAEFGMLNCGPLAAFDVLGGGILRRVLVLSRVLRYVR